MFKNKDFDHKMIPARYVNRFIALNSLEEFGRYGLFPNVKEVTESFGMYYAVTHKIMPNEPDIEQGKRNVRIYVVGDGVTPRTAAVFAFMTKWECISIDPQMRDRDYSGIRRLKVYRKKIEDYIPYTPLQEIHNLWPDDKYHIIIMPHSHADIQPTWDILQNDRTWLITMPCCVHHKLDLPCIEYRDKFVGSPKNHIKIYCNYM